jgi:hypothetical protein
MRKRETRPFAEQDAFGRWGRKYLCYIQRAGVRSGIKRGARVRERQEAKGRIRQGQDDLPAAVRTPDPERQVTADEDHRDEADDDQVLHRDGLVDPADAGRDDEDNPGDDSEHGGRLPVGASNLPR